MSPATRLDNLSYSHHREVASGRLYQALKHSEFFSWSDDYTVSEVSSLVTDYGIKEIQKNRGFGGKYVSPQVYDELEEITGLNRQTIQQYKSTATMLDSNLRNDNLSFTHHRAVAPLPPEEQKHFLQKASEENLSERVESPCRQGDLSFH